MKIIIFDGSFQTTVFINRLIEGLVKKGHDIYVLGYNESFDSPIQGVKYIGIGSNQSKLKLILRSIKLGVISRNFYIFYKSIHDILNHDKKKLQENNLNIIINKIKPDIIHLQWPVLLFNLKNIKIDKKTKIILSHRGSQISVKARLDNEFRKNILPFYNQVDAIHSVSQAIKNLANDLNLKANTENKVIYSGFNLSDFEFKNTKKNNPPFKIISVGRNHWVKGYTFALDTCKTLKDKNFSFSYEIIGIDHQTEELIFQRKQLQLQEEVIFSQKLPFETVKSKIQKADLLLLPSIAEGIANVVLEAMALGTLVLSTNCGGMSEVINDGENGFLMPIRNSEIMAEKIIDISKLSFEKVGILTINARQTIERQHNIVEMIMQFEELYLKTLKS